MPDSAILAGELYLAHLRRLQSLSDSHERAGFSKQFQDIVRIYADLIDVRTEIDSMFGGGGGTATTEVSAKVSPFS